MHIGSYKDYDFYKRAYQYGHNVSIEVFEDGMPFGVLSVNLHGHPCADNVQLDNGEFVLNHDFLRYTKLLKSFLNSNLFADTGKRVNYGYCENVPVWRLK